MSIGTLMTATPSQSSQIFHLTEYSATASFIIIVWDALLTIDDEVTYIWPKPRGAYIKWLYLFPKYWTLALQIGIFYFHVNFVAYHPIPAPWCGVYRGIQVGGSQVLMLILDIVLLLRIYALYERKSFAMSLGAFAILLELTTAVVGDYLVIPTISYDSACLVVVFPKHVIVLIVGTLASQMTLLWLAYRKKERVIRAEQGRTSIASITIRDGVIAFACVVALFLVLLGIELTDSLITNMVFFWFPVFISIATCRLIMHPQQASHAEVTVTTQHLSTEIWTPDYELQTRSAAP